MRQYLYGEWSRATPTNPGTSSPRRRRFTDQRLVKRLVASFCFISMCHSIATHRPVRYPVLCSINHDDLGQVLTFGRDLGEQVVVAGLLTG